MRWLYQATMITWMMCIGDKHLQLHSKGDVGCVSSESQALDDNLPKVWPSKGPSDPSSTTSHHDLIPPHDILYETHQNVSSALNTAGLHLLQQFGSLAPLSHSLS